MNNLPQQYTACFGNVHLLALCYTQDIKNYGFEPLLEKFVSEMRELSTTGFSGIFPVLGDCTVHASLCQVTCDNLALNGILGLVESSSGDYCCPICYATADDIQCKFSEDLFQLRTKAAYEKDISDLPAAKKQGKVHSRGVKRYCVLNEIDGFHVTDNYCLDVMHTVIEGIIPAELGCVLHGLCADKCVTLEQVNREFFLLWGEITVDKTHKPAEITRLQEPGHGIVPSMKAVQYLALLKYLPLAVGKYVPPENKHWKFLLHLCHLVDLILAPRFTRDMVSYLRIVVRNHLSMFSETYCNEHIRCRPKHHLLVHLPTIVLKSGPLIGMSCMRYELKNSFFKRCAHIVSNFTNICHTLAYRHQQFALYCQLSNSHIRTAVTVGFHTVVHVATLPFCTVVMEKFHLQENDTVAVTGKLCVASVEYRTGHYLLLDVDKNTGNKIFGRIVQFVCLSDDDIWHVVVDQVTTAEYDLHFCCYSIVCHSDVFSLHSFCDFADYHPLCCHTVIANSAKKFLLRLPYHVF